MKGYHQILLWPIIISISLRPHPKNSINAASIKTISYKISRDPDGGDSRLKDDLNIFGGDAAGYDRYSMCCGWAMIGECYRNERFMRTQCQRSCGTIGCIPSAASECSVRVNVESCPWTPAGLRNIKPPRGGPSFSKNRKRGSIKSNRKRGSKKIVRIVTGIKFEKSKKKKKKVKRKKNSSSSLETQDLIEAVEGVLRERLPDLSQLAAVENPGRRRSEVQRERKRQILVGESKNHESGLRKSGKKRRRSRAKDIHAFCCGWAAEGQCDTNPVWMRHNCQKSCGTFGCPAGLPALKCAIQVHPECSVRNRRRLRASLQLAPELPPIVELRADDFLAYEDNPDVALEEFLEEGGGNGDGDDFLSDLSNYGPDEREIIESVLNPTDYSDDDDDDDDGFVVENNQPDKIVASPPSARPTDSSSSLFETDLDFIGNSDDTTGGSGGIKIAPPSARPFDHIPEPLAAEEQAAGRRQKGKRQQQRKRLRGRITSRSVTRKRIDLDKPLLRGINSSPSRRGRNTSAQPPGVVRPLSTNQKTVGGRNTGQRSGEGSRRFINVRSPATAPLLIDEMPLEDRRLRLPLLTKRPPTSASFVYSGYTTPTSRTMTIPPVLIRNVQNGVYGSVRKPERPPPNFQYPPQTEVNKPPAPPVVTSGGYGSVEPERIETVLEPTYGYSKPEKVEVRAPPPSPPPAYGYYPEPEKVEVRAPPPNPPPALGYYPESEKVEVRMPETPPSYNSYYTPVPRKIEAEIRETPSSVVVLEPSGYGDAPQKVEVREPPPRPAPPAAYGYTEKVEIREPPKPVSPATAPPSIVPPSTSFSAGAAIVEAVAPPIIDTDTRRSVVVMEKPSFEPTPTTIPAPSPPPPPHPHPHQSSSSSIVHHYHHHVPQKVIQQQLTSPPPPYSAYHEQKDRSVLPSASKPSSSYKVYADKVFVHVQRDDEDDDHPKPPIKPPEIRERIIYLPAVHQPQKPATASAESGKEYEETKEQKPPQSYQINPEQLIQQIKELLLQINDGGSYSVGSKKDQYQYQEKPDTPSSPVKQDVRETVAAAEIIIKTATAQPLLPTVPEPEAEPTLTAESEPESGPEPEVYKTKPEPPRLLTDIPKSPKPEPEPEPESIKIEAESKPEPETAVEDLGPPTININQQVPRTDEKKNGEEKEIWSKLEALLASINTTRNIQSTLVTATAQPSVEQLIRGLHLLQEAGFNPPPPLGWSQSGQQPRRPPVLGGQSSHSAKNETGQSLNRSAGRQSSIPSAGRQSGQSAAHSDKSGRQSHRRATDRNQSVRSPGSPGWIQSHSQSRGRPGWVWVDSSRRPGHRSQFTVSPGRSHNQQPINKSTKPWPPDSHDPSSITTVKYHHRSRESSIISTTTLPVPFDSFPDSEAESFLQPVDQSTTKNVVNPPPPAGSAWVDSAPRNGRHVDGKQNIKGASSGGIRIPRKPSWKPEEQVKVKTTTTIKPHRQKPPQASRRSGIRSKSKRRPPSKTPQSPTAGGNIATVVEEVRVDLEPFSISGRRRSVISKTSPPNRRQWRPPLSPFPTAASWRQPQQPPTQKPSIIFPMAQKRRTPRPKLTVPKQPELTGFTVTLPPKTTTTSTTTLIPKPPFRVSFAAPVSPPTSPSVWIPPPPSKNSTIFNGSRLSAVENTPPTRPPPRPPVWTPRRSTRIPLVVSVQQEWESRRQNETDDSRRRPLSPDQPIIFLPKIAPGAFDPPTSTTNFPFEFSSSTTPSSPPDDGLEWPAFPPKRRPPPTGFPRPNSDDIFAVHNNDPNKSDKMPTPPPTPPSEGQDNGPPTIKIEGGSNNSDNPNILSSSVGQTSSADGEDENNQDETEYLDYLEYQAAYGDDEEADGDRLIAEINELNSLLRTEEDERELRTISVIQNERKKRRRIRQLLRKLRKRIKNRISFS